MKRLLRNEYGIKDIGSVKLCEYCRGYIRNASIPSLSKTNGFTYPAIPGHLPKLDLVSERLISPRIPFMEIRRLRQARRLIGQVINVPVDVSKMTRVLPRIYDDMAVNVQIKRMQIHRSSFLEGYVKRRVLKEWLTSLLQTPLYQQYRITVDEGFLDQPDGERAREGDVDEIDENEDGRYHMQQQQKTMLWSEDQCLILAPAAGEKPLNLMYDEHAEELSFPSIYFGHGRKFQPGLRVTPFMIATSEIRRADRRGVTPQHILYMAAKLLRYRLALGLRHEFKGTVKELKIMRDQIESEGFVEKLTDRNLSFLRTMPNSVSYWMDRKRELYAMMRQLGKPTMFLTLSASEYQWPGLLNKLYELRHGQKYDGDIMKLKAFKRAELVNEDPVTVVLYFHKLVEKLMLVLRKKDGPFGDYCVLDYFKRYEFQHRGSPHAHIILWLSKDPCEELSEDMPETIRMVDRLSTVVGDALARPRNQYHEHTFTCARGKENRYRFGVSFWPMDRSRILLPKTCKAKK